MTFAQFLHETYPWWALGLGLIGAVAAVAIWDVIRR